VEKGLNFGGKAAAAGINERTLEKENPVVQR